MMVGVLIMQLVMFGFAINSDPRHLPTPSTSPMTASLPAPSALLSPTSYLDIVAVANTPKTRSGCWMRARSISHHDPVNFARSVRGVSPQVLIQADASDPAAAPTRSPRLPNRRQPRSRMIWSGL
jgi:ABC-2 type transport system permease protein